MRYCSSHSLLSASLLLLLGSTQTLAQLAFTNVPSTVNDGQSVQVSWTGGDGVNPVQVDLVQNGAVVDDELLDDVEGTPTTFTWSVDLDDDAVGGTYTLRLTSGGVTALSNPINIIDENGGGAPAPSAAAPSTAAGTPVATAAPSTAVGDGASTQPTQSSAGGSSATAASGGSGGSSATGGAGGGSGGGSSSIPSTGIAASSASIAATASTLLTTTIDGSAITITPEPTNTNDAAAASGSNSGSGSTGLSGGAIAGIVIGVLAIIALIVGALWFLRRRRAKKSRTSTYTPGVSTFNSGSEKNPGPDRGNEYLQPSSFGVLGMRGGAHDPRSPNTTSDTGPSELYSSPTANTASEVHSNSLSPELPAATPRSVPANTYEMPASMPFAATGATTGTAGAAANQNLYEAPSSNEKVNSPQTAKSPGEQYQNFRSPVSELSSDGTTGTGSRSSYSDAGAFMSPVPRKAVGGFGGLGGEEGRRGDDKYVV